VSASRRKQAADKRACPDPERSPEGEHRNPAGGAGPPDLSIMCCAVAVAVSERRSASVCDGVSVRGRVDVVTQVLRSTTTLASTLVFYAAHEYAVPARAGLPRTVRVRSAPPAGRAAADARDGVVRSRVRDRRSPVRGV
jgi:hypothetical protein